LQGSSAKALDFKGKLSLNQLELWGGPLGADHPRIKGISAEINATISQGVLSLKQLSLQSSLANGSAQGSVAGRGQKQFQGSADIDKSQREKKRSGNPD